MSVTAAINSIKTINRIKNKLYFKLERMCKTMVEEIDDLASDYHIPVSYTHLTLPTKA